MPNSGGERELFEVAHAYRAVYALFADYDRQPILTVSAAIAYGELTYVWIASARRPIQRDR